jgi:hypothetical protein
VLSQVRTLTDSFSGNSQDDVLRFDDSATVTCSGAYAPTAIDTNGTVNCTVGLPQSLFHSCCNVAIN